MDNTSLTYSVLIVEDERAIAENIFYVLEAEQMVADTAHSVASAKRLLERERYDAVILDVGLPDQDGFQLLSFMREQRQLSTPVLMLTARATLEDKMRGFTSGVDDYLTKPFALEELVLRVKALIRRSKQLSEAAYVLHHGPLSLTVATREVHVSGVGVKLTRKGYMILELLMRHGGRVVSRQQLEESVWQGEPPSTEALRSQLHLLRKAINIDNADWIETIHGVGWRLAAVDSTEA